MAKRWALCALGDFENDGNRVPKFNLYPVNSRIWTKAGSDWCFGQIATDNVSEMAADPDIYVLPDGSMDMSVGSIPTTVRAEMKARIESAGLSFTAIKTTWTVRQMLNHIAGQFQSGVDVEVGDVQDVSSF